MKKFKLKIPKIKFFKFNKFLTFKKKPKRVITLIGNSMYIYENKEIFKEEISYIKGVVTSVVSFKDSINISFKLSIALDKEELLIEAEKYVYNQGILDLTKEYQIIYNFQQYEDFYYVDAFAIETDKLQILNKEYLSEFKYIDFISFAPFAFGEFYEISKISPEVDAFVYFHKNDSYIVGFKGGEFVFIRSLDKLNVLEKELNKSAEEIIELLKEKGIDKNRYDDYTYEVIDTFFSKLFMKINNIVNYSVNFFKLDKINNIYFYAPFDMNYFAEFYKDIWNFDVKFKKYELLTNYDPFEYSVALYNAKYYDKENLNFSVFKRPPALYKRESGKLILFIFFLILIVISDALYKEYVISKTEQKKLLIELQAQSYKNTLDKTKRQIKFYKKEIKNLKKEWNALSSKIDYIYKKIERLYILDNKPSFTNIYAKIVSVLQKNNLKIYEFKKINNEFSLIIVSSQSVYDKIPLFLIDLKREGFKNIKIHSVENNSTAYKTKVMFDE